MKQYTMVACDLDGTLLNDEMKISSENINAIQQLTARNVLFVPATGRTISEMKEISENPDIRYLIYSNGAVVFDKKIKQYIYMCLSKEISNFILDTLRLYDVYIIMHHNGQTYSKKINDEIVRKYRINTTVYTLVQECANI